jgi:hypothetical protein
VDPSTRLQLVTRVALRGVPFQPLAELPECRIDELERGSEKRCVIVQGLLPSNVIPFRTHGMHWKGFFKWVNVYGRRLVNIVGRSRDRNTNRSSARPCDFRVIRTDRPLICVKRLRSFDCERG